MILSVVKRTQQQVRRRSQRGVPGNGELRELLISLGCARSELRGGELS